MINSIHIENFKCLRNTVVNFRHITVLAGSNSVGKSSVIQALLLTKIALDKLSSYSTVENNNIISDNEIKIPLNGKYLLNLGNTREVLSRDVNSNIITFSLFDEKENNMMRLDFISEDNKEDYYDLGLKELKFKSEFNNLKNEFYYLNAERIGPRLTYDVEQQEYAHVGWQGEFTIQVLAQNKENIIINPQKRGYQNLEDSKLLSQVRAWMEYIIPGFYLDSADLEGKLKKAHTTYSKSSPTNVGFGISYVLPIVVNALIAKENTMFIVENPEAHLHPKGQSNIGYFLGQMSNSGLQVLIETHSEHVVNGIRRAALSNENNTDGILVNFFNKDSNKNSFIKEIKVSKFGDLSSFPKDFFDQAQTDMAEFFNHQIKMNG